MSPELRRIPDYLLERVAADELPAAERAAMLDALAREPGGNDRLEGLTRDDSETLARIPSAAFAARVAERAGRRRSRAPWLALPTAAAAAVVLVVALRPAPPPGPVESQDVTRVKGLRPHLVVHRDTKGVDAVLPSGAAARPGDLLQLGYVAAGMRFGVIVSIDGRGVATLHYPSAGEPAGPLVGQREGLLAESYRLDDAPGFERFFLVTADAPFAVDEVLRAARALAGGPDPSHAPLSVDGRLSVSSTLILKEVR